MAPDLNSSDARKENADGTAGKLSVLNELYVDLLGSLVPGLYTVILRGFILALTFSTIYGMIYPAAPLSKDSFTFLKELIGSLHYELAVITLVSAYVVGSVFFRQDPKTPDEESAVFVWLKASDNERRGLAVQSDGPEKNPKKVAWFQRIKAALRPAWYAEALHLDTQFPYLYLRCYLTARGLTHLTEYVPWYARDGGKTKSFRTKMFLNILKIRLLSLRPELCRDVVRNEAHVRLATSVWYSSTWLFLLACFCQISLLIALIPNRHQLPLALSSAYAPGVVTVFVMILCFAMRSQLRKCIHYMRVREVVYVLEAWHIARQKDRTMCFSAFGSTNQEAAMPCQRCLPMRADNQGMFACAPTIPAVPDTQEAFKLEPGRTSFPQPPLTDPPVR